ncbi:hypothetical protein KR52_11990 [Synechococcus sp. KORDI-52]|nr:hypothetical protein KR52_11990 [Synechococcus sp. KORDI-52]
MGFSEEMLKNIASLYLQDKHSRSTSIHLAANKSTANRTSWN